MIQVCIYYALCLIKLSYGLNFRKFNLGVLLVLYVVSLSVTGSDKAKRGIYHSFFHEDIENRIRWKTDKVEKADYHQDLYKIGKKKMTKESSWEDFFLMS